MTFSLRFVTFSLRFVTLCVLQVKYTDILWLAVKLYNNPALKSHLLTKLEKLSVGNGDRQYTELNTGLWWEKTEAEMQRQHPVSTVSRFVTIRYYLCHDLSRFCYDS